MSFYILRRTLEDIWEFLEQLTFDEMLPNERETALAHLAGECERLRNTKGKWKR